MHSAMRFVWWSSAECAWKSSLAKFTRSIFSLSLSSSEKGLLHWVSEGKDEWILENTWRLIQTCLYICKQRMNHKFWLSLSTKSNEIEWKFLLNTSEKHSPVLWLLAIFIIPFRSIHQVPYLNIPFRSFQKIPGLLIGGVRVFLRRVLRAGRRVHGEIYHWSSNVESPSCISKRASFFVTFSIVSCGSHSLATKNPTRIIAALKHNQFSVRSKLFWSLISPLSGLPRLLPPVRYSLLAMASGADVPATAHSGTVTIRRVW